MFQWNRGDVKFNISINFENSEQESRFVGLMQSYDQYLVRVKASEPLVGHPQDLSRPQRSFQVNLLPGQCENPFLIQGTQPQLQIWHTAPQEIQVFSWHVPSLLEARQVINVLERYDFCLFGDRAKKDRHGFSVSTKDVSGLLWYGISEQDGNAWETWETNWAYKLHEIPEHILQTWSYEEIFEEYVDLTR